MRLFFQIQNLLLLIFCMVDLEYMSTLDYTLFYNCIKQIMSIVIKINRLYLLNVSLLHTLEAFVPYGYVLILSKVCNLLSSLLLSAFLLTSSVYTHCASLLSLCSGMISFLKKQSL